MNDNKETEVATKSGEPYVEIVEQPASDQIKFRTESDDKVSLTFQIISQPM